MADEDFALTINGVRHTIEADDLEIWEVEFLEETCDAPLEAIDFGRVKALRALTWLIMRRSNPSITYEAVGRLKLSAIGGEPDAEPDPTPAPAKAPKKRSAPRT